MKKESFSSTQARLLLACSAAYTAAYFCRLNLSAALGNLMDDLSLSMTRAGMLQTVFALVYATGQLVNGAVIDRIARPGRYLMLGLLGSACCNLVMSAASSHPMLLLIWALNAAFQSMMWTPIMRLVALHFSPGVLRERANAVLALTLIVGHLGAWAISGLISGYAGWRFSFAAPALIALFVLGAVFPLLAQVKTDSPISTSSRRQADMPILSMFISSGFFPVLVTCVLYGFIRDGVITWSPVILASLSGGQSLTAAAFSLILPLINFFGVLLGFEMRRRGKQPHGVVVLLMIPAVICSMLLIKNSSMLLCAVLLGCICAGMYGANTMLTGLIPLEYDCVGRTGLTAGLIDSMIYAGSALAGAAGGRIYEACGHQALHGTWIFAALLCMLLMHIAGRKSAVFFLSLQHSSSSHSRQSTKEDCL